MIIPKELDNQGGRDTAIFLKEPRRLIEVFASSHAVPVGAFLWHSFAIVTADEFIQLSPFGREFLREIENVGFHK